jgi:putative tryptophan/tyrosine transport system substrate-binding protein
MLKLEDCTRRPNLLRPGSAAAWPVVARAQQPDIPVIGFLDTSSLEATKEIVANFRGGLRDVGYVEGKNVAIEFR